MSVLLDEIEGGVSTGWEEGKSVLKLKITCAVMRMFSMWKVDWIYLISSNVAHLKLSK